MADHYVLVETNVDGRIMQIRVPVTLQVLRAYEGGSHKLYRLMRTTGQCECAVWQRCIGDCHICKCYVPLDRSATPELLDVVVHSRDEYGASAEEIALQRITLQSIVEQLTDFQRNVLLMRGAGFDTTEIAEMTGASYERVRWAWEIVKRIADTLR